MGDDDIVDVVKQPLLDELIACSGQKENIFFTVSATRPDRQKRGVRGELATGDVGISVLKKLFYSSAGMFVSSRPLLIDSVVKDRTNKVRTHIKYGKRVNMFSNLVLLQGGNAICTLDPTSSPKRVTMECWGCFEGLAKRRATHEASEAGEAEGADDSAEASKAKDSHLMFL